MEQSVKTLDMRIGKMIEQLKNYKITLTEEQARQLYNLMQSAKSADQFSYGGLYDDLRDLHKELKDIFGKGTPFSGGIR